MNGVLLMKFKQQNSNQGRIILIALIAGLVGGGIGAYGVQYMENRNPEITTGKTTQVQVTDSDVKGKSQATKAFNQTSATVVSVINLQKQTSSGWDWFSNVNKDDDDNSNLTKASEGSGVIYKKANNDAYIVTNNHVVEDSNAVQVLLSNGTKLNASVVGTDKTSDLAVLKIKADKVSKVAAFANSNEVQTGESVLAIGSPLGSQYATSVTEGIISATKREVQSTDEAGNTLGKATVMQTDAAINPGNSGGALINMAGQVIGINSMKLASSGSGTEVEGMGFAIPSNIVVNIINQLEKNGKVERPALGIQMVDLSRVSIADQESRLKLSTDTNSGVVLLKVESNGPAANAGLQKYDVITNADGKEIQNSSDLQGVINAHKVGDTIDVTYYRDGKRKNVEIKL